MQYLWNVDEMLKALAAQVMGADLAGVGGISIDSRSLKDGDLFFAIQGEMHDGHDFLSQAIAAGAKAVVIDSKKKSKLDELTKETLAKVTVFLVDNVLESLEKLAQAARERSIAKVIAVTGSVGKTSTKELFLSALSSLGKVHISPASFNNHWGVPLSLARLPKDADYAVFELGMSGKGEIAKLSAMVQPHVGIVTLIAPAHLGHFANLEEIAAAKAELFANIVKGGAAFINRDDELFNILATYVPQDIETKYFGNNSESNYSASDINITADQITFNFNIQNKKKYPVKLELMAKHMVTNTLAVLGVIDYLESDVEKAIEGLSNFSPCNGRGNKYLVNLSSGSDSNISSGKILLIDESYNANPTSMEASLRFLSSLRPNDGGRNIAILADMLELGDKSAYYHEKLADVILEENIDEIFLLGENMKLLQRKLSQDKVVIHRDDINKLFDDLIKTFKNGDNIMLKGSNSMKLSSLVSKIRNFYSNSDTNNHTKNN